MTGHWQTPPGLALLLWLHKTLLEAKKKEIDARIERIQQALKR